MKKFILALALVVPLAACSSTEKGAVGGGLIGAAVGAAVNDNPVEGAIVGGAIGAAAGAVLGRVTDRPGYCQYRDRRTGEVYEAECPRGYR